MSKIVLRTLVTLAAVTGVAGAGSSGNASAFAPAESGRTVRISVVAGGEPNDISGISSNPVVDSRGEVVAFDSAATNLVSGDTNEFDDVFVRDRVSDQTERVSISSAGDQANGDSTRPSISGDGEVIAFESVASNLVPRDTGGPDVFVRDRGVGSTVRVSERADGKPGNGPSITPSISRNGWYVAFASDATNLAGTPVSGGRDILVRDLLTGAIEVASLKQDGDPAGGGSASPAISADGRYVAFQSFAADIVPGDTNDNFDVFVRDRVLGETSIVSVSSAGGIAEGGASFAPAISADGHTVVFASDATTLVAGDSNDVTDAFAHDLQSGQTERVSLGPGGVQSNDQSVGPGVRGGAVFGPEVSRTGRYVTYDSIASNLVAADTNTCSIPLGQTYDEPGQCPDVFVRDRLLDVTTRESVGTSEDQANHASTDPAISNRGRDVVFFTLASNLVRHDTNVCRKAIFGGQPGRCPDIYLRSK